MPMFGKTGTTTGPTDVWFVGGTSDLIAGVYVGYDTPRNLGGYAQGGTVSAPIIKSFFEKIRKRLRPEPFVAPAGVRMVRVDRMSGKRVFDAWPSDDPKASVIWEAFKPDTEPPRSTRRDEIEAKRKEILAIIRSGQRGASSQSRTEVETKKEDFVEDQGGIY
jgi:penicillin-binding protein 1A